MEQCLYLFTSIYKFRAIQWHFCVSMPLHLVTIRIQLLFIWRWNGNEKHQVIISRISMLIYIQWLLLGNPKSNTKPSFHHHKLGEINSPEEIRLKWICNNKLYSFHAVYIDINRRKKRVLTTLENYRTIQRKKGLCAMNKIKCLDSGNVY